MGAVRVHRAGRPRRGLRLRPDIGDVIGFATSRPEQVNLRQLIVLPTVQV
jgi:hypothetical protein